MTRKCMNHNKAIFCFIEHDKNEIDGKCLIIKTVNEQTVL